MKLHGRTVLVCNCEKTMPLDGEALGRACGAAGPARIDQQLCRAQTDKFLRALADGPLLVGCTQERPLFTEQAEDAGRPDSDIRFVNIRERAGWSDEAAAATPKIAALLAEAALALPPTPLVSLRSEGVALVYGRDEAAIEAGRRLADKLNVTVMLTRPVDVIPPASVDFPVVRGTIRTATGHLGAFDIVVDEYAQPLPSSRRALAFGLSRDGAKSACDIIIDLSGGTPLFPAHHKRDGYLRADPASPAEVAEILWQAADLVGEFDKPRYVDYRADLCAHSRNRRTGCTRCLDVCPTGAITPNGDHVAIDPYVCAGCGSCASVCPTGAASYALPTHGALLERVRTLLLTYREAGGAKPVLLLHEGEHGAPLIDLLARLGDGLPARVIPMQVNEVTQLGIEVFAAAIAYGAAEVRVLVQRRHRDDLEPLRRTLDLAETVLSGLGYGADRCALVETDDPDDLGAVLRGLAKRDGVAPRPFLPMGDKRGLMRLSLREAHAAAPTPVDVIPLAAGAPFGTLDIRVDGCTLCLACVGVCPTGALSDDPDRPRLSFTQDACVQCGLCRNTCPEKVISLVPQLDFRPEARSPILVKEEEPAECIRCGKQFGTRSTVERIVAKLQDQHWMYKAGGAAGLAGAGTSPIDRIRMCADCRVIAQTESTFDPYAGPARPKTRTTEDYLKEREEGTG